MQIAIFVTLLSVLLFTSTATAQQNRSPARGQYRSSFIQAPPKSFRVSLNPRQLPAQSVITSDFQGAASAPWQPNGNVWVEGTMNLASSGFGSGSSLHPAGRSRAEFDRRFSDSTNKVWGNGFYQNVTGDIFGVSADRDCCDEWAGHCACLELTSSQSNCECTNPRRAHWANGNGRGGGGGCESCSRSQAGGSVSDYFHQN